MLAFARVLNLDIYNPSLSSESHDLGHPEKSRVSFPVKYISMHLSDVRSTYIVAYHFMLVQHLRSTLNQYTNKHYSRLSNITHAIGSALLYNIHQNLQSRNINYMIKYIRGLSE